MWWVIFCCGFFKFFNLLFLFLAFGGFIWKIENFFQYWKCAGDVFHSEYCRQIHKSKQTEKNVFLNTNRCLRLMESHGDLKKLRKKKFWKEQRILIKHSETDWVYSVSIYLMDLIYCRNKNLKHFFLSFNFNSILYGKLLKDFFPIEIIERSITTKCCW